MGLLWISRGPCGRGRDDMQPFQSLLKSPSCRDGKGIGWISRDWGRTLGLVSSIQYHGTCHWRSPQGVSTNIRPHQESQLGMSTNARECQRQMSLQETKTRLHSMFHAFISLSLFPYHCLQPPRRQRKLRIGKTSKWRNWEKAHHTSCSHCSRPGQSRPRLGL